MPLISFRRRNKGVLLTATVGLAGLVLGYALLRRSFESGPMVTPPEDPRLSFATPFQNVKPGVRYLGDKACGECHRGITEKYHRHPMGQSITPLAEIQHLERLERETRNPFAAAELEFRVRRQGVNELHQVVRRGADNQTVAESDARVDYAVGAGKRGRSYLIDRAGYLYQSPISWYEERKRWDLSPHLGRTIDQLYRPVTVQCMFCHANYADWVEGSGNHFGPLAQADLAIGCERCHGPGELHVAQRKTAQAVPEVDYTIVHPGHLAPELRESVCEQCHLEGVVRIDHRGRKPFDFRPGLPLSAFVSVFVRSPEQNDQRHFASQVEQMAASTCFRESNGKLGCISCHDPHETPDPATRVLYYRDRCLSCHDTESCSLAPARRKERSAADSCIDCHMPKFAHSDIAHMASTDHRILRQVETGPKNSAPAAPTDDLVSFYKSQTSPDDTLRDEALALMDQAGLKQASRHRLWLARIAAPVLEKSLQKWPDDVRALHAYGYALWLENRREGALAAFEKALQLSPEREETLAFAAGVAAQQKDTGKALAYWR